MRQVQRDAMFSEYVASRQAMLRRVAYSLCGNWHEAEDLLQVALTKLYVAWPRIHRAGAEDAYVRRILLTTRIDQTRSASRRELPGLEGFDTESPATPGPEQRSELVDALQLLPLMQRRVVVLRYVGDLSVHDTATELGISPGTVKSHTSRALARLEEILTPAVTQEAKP